MEENILLCKQSYYDVYASLVNSRGVGDVYNDIMGSHQTQEEADEDRVKLIE
jgi:hypothetical protein